MTDPKQPNLSRGPQEGAYEGIAWFLLEGLLNQNLPEYVWHDLALVNEELMRPIRKHLEEKGVLFRDSIRKFLKSDDPPKAIFAIRISPFVPGLRDDSEIYIGLKEMFLNIRVPNVDKWQLQMKRYLTTTLPYFESYNADDEIKEEMLSYFEGTRQEQVNATLAYFGAKNWPQRFLEALNDEKRKSKHWVYIWYFKAIYQERKGGDFSPETKNQLEDAIQNYRDNHGPNLSEFERQIINESLSV